MAECINEEPWVIESGTGEDHTECLSRALSYCRDKGVKLDSGKCVFAMAGEDGKVTSHLHKVKMPRLQASAPLAVLDLEGEAEELRVKGNKCYQKSDYDGALEFYTRSVDKVLETLPDGARQLKAEFLLSSFMSAQSNKVETLIRLGRLSAADREAELALQFDPKHVKTLCRQARALQKRQLHRLARECLERALEAGPDNEEVRAEMKKAKEFCDQQQYGSHEVAECILGLDSQEPEPEYADYIGPVEVKMTEDGKGRGLFATRDVQAGELLLVTSAVVYNVVGARYHLRTCLNQLKLAAQDSFATLKSLTLLADKKQKDVPMDVFRPAPGLVMYELGSEYQVDIQFLNKVYNDNSVRVQRGNKQCEGLWILPSFINHSCCPNASQHLLGRVAFNVAAVPIAAGEEIVCSYFDTLLPWTFRRQESMKIGEFECNCKRCGLEKRMDKALAHLSRTFQVYHGKDFDAWSSTERRRVCAGYSRVVDELELHLTGDKLSEEEKMWLEASYVDAYFHQTEVAFEPSNLARAVRAACPTDTRLLCKIYHFCTSNHSQEESDLIYALIEEACFSVFGRCSEQQLQALADSVIRG